MIVPHKGPRRKIIITAPEMMTFIWQIDILRRFLIEIRGSIIAQRDQILKWTICHAAPVVTVIRGKGTIIKATKSTVENRSTIFISITLKLEMKMSLVER